MDDKKAKPTDKDSSIYEGLAGISQRFAGQTVKQDNDKSAASHQERLAKTATGKNGKSL